MIGRVSRKNDLVKSMTVFLILVAGVLLISEREILADDFDLPCSKQIAITAVHNAAIGIGGVIRAVKNEKEVIEIIRNFTDPIRFYPDETGYFYVYDFHCVNIAHARQKDIQDKSLYNYQDSKGNFVIRKLAEAAKNGGGFVEFYWIKPGDQGEHKKLGYVEAIPGTNYFIGSGVYLR